MKKALVISVLLALPISIYIIFATAVHHFSYLPVLTENVQGLDDFQDAEGVETTYGDRVTLLCFFGKHIEKMKGNAYNLHEKIYKKHHIYKDFQIVVIAHENDREQSKQLLKELHDFTGDNTSKWHFVFGNDQQIRDLFDNLHTPYSLNEDGATPYVFIIDKEQNLRGRKENEEFLYGYETASVAAINNTLADDINIVLAEYRLKEKKERERFLKNEQ